LNAIISPGFSTGGIILAVPAFAMRYRTGRGSIMMHGRAEIETSKGDRESHRHQPKFPIR